jgi:hypothetical protein
MSNLTAIFESIESKGAFAKAESGSEMYNLYERKAQEFDSTNKNMASRVREEGLRRASALMKGGRKTRKVHKKRRVKKTRKQARS